MRVCPTLVVLIESQPGDGRGCANQSCKKSVLLWRPLCYLWTRLRLLVVSFYSPPMWQDNAEIPADKFWISQTLVMLPGTCFAVWCLTNVTSLEASELLLLWWRWDALLLWRRLDASGFGRAGGSKRSLVGCKEPWCHTILYGRWKNTDSATICCGTCVEDERWSLIDLESNLYNYNA